MGDISETRERAWLTLAERYGATNQRDMDIAALRTRDPAMADWLAEQPLFRERLPEKEASR